MSGVEQGQPRVGVGAAILVDGRLLLVKRRHPPEAGCWGLPGGKVDWLEPLADAVRREIREELGIGPDNPALLCVVDQIDEPAGQHWVAPVFLVTRLQGTPSIQEPDKHEAWGWFPLDSLPGPLTRATQQAAAALARLPGHR